MKLKSLFAEAQASQPQCFFCKGPYAEGHSCKGKQQLQSLVKQIVYRRR